MKLESIVNDESTRRAMFPVAAKEIYLAHAGVAPITAAARDAIRRFADDGAEQLPESPWVWQQFKDCRKLAGDLIGATEHEIALVGPTSFGLNLVAQGLDWNAGDQVIYYEDDYPANVYAWMELRRRGVEPVPIRTDSLAGLGAITWDAIEPLLTDRTKLVSLATCNFLSGYRLDYAEIGRRLRERGILFCLDAIQTLGAFAMDVEHVDFLAADSHKWMLGPTGAGIFYVRRQLQDTLRPAVLGAWNVTSPKFIAQREIAFEAGGRRYESGALNAPGNVGMAASMRLLLDVGIDAIADRLIELHRGFLENLRPLGYERYLSDMPDDAVTGIVTVRHPSVDMPAMFERLRDAGVTASLRHDRAGEALLRFSPHFYNTAEELGRVIDILRERE